MFSSVPGLHSLEASDHLPVQTVETVSRHCQSPLGRGAQLLLGSPLAAKHSQTPYMCMNERMNNLFFLLMVTISFKCQAPSNPPSVPHDFINTEIIREESRRYIFY